jgi:hypothetical protein
MAFVDFLKTMGGVTLSDEVIEAARKESDKDGKDKGAKTPHDEDEREENGYHN